MSRDFLVTREAHVDTPAAYRGALDELWQGDLQVLLLRGVFSPDVMARVVARLERDGAGFDELRFGPEFHAYMLGMGLDFAPSLERYLDGVAPWRRACVALFDGLGDFEAKMDQVFATLGGERTVAVPELQGRACLPDSFRRLPPTGLIPPHAELEQTTRPPYAPFNPLIDGVTLMSYFVCLAPGDAGGELSLHDFTWAEIDAALMHRGRTRVDQALPARARSTFRPGPGDMIVFDGGRYVHQVLPVEGQVTRWTGGGFVARARGGERYLRWC